MDPDELFRSDPLSGWEDENETENDEIEVEEPRESSRDKAMTILQRHSARYFTDAGDAMAIVCGNVANANAVLAGLEQHTTPMDRWKALPLHILQEVMVRGVPWKLLCEWMGVPIITLHQFLKSDEAARGALEEAKGVAADVAAQEADMLMAIPESAPAVANRLSAMAAHLRWLAGSYAPGTYGTKSVPPAERRGQLVMTQLPESAPDVVETQEVETKEGFANVELPTLRGFEPPRR